jgi:4-amino-4-deoxy-L-arabinose transferase-like glycosyltransferase
MRFGIDPLRPRYDDLSNIQSGKDNPQGYRMVEFPLYQIFGAYIGNMIPTVSIEVILRVLTAIASTLTGLALGILILRRIGVVAGIATAFIYAVLPYSMYYGRSILPDPHAVMWAMGSVLCFDVAMTAIKGKWLYIVLAAVLGAIALLSKPVAGFLLLPIIGLVLAERKNLLPSIGMLFLYGIIALIPFLLWRQWILQYPEGIAVYTWLFNANNIRFKGAWFHWLFAERIAKLLLGYWGMILLGFGIIAPIKDKQKGILLWFIIGSLSYMTILAAGNVQHDYYQIIILPTVVALVGTGIGWILIQKANRIALYLTGFVSVVFMCMFSWYVTRTYYWINRPEIVEAGRMANSLLPKDAKVIAPYNGDTTFLYQTGRQGWPLGFEIDKKIQMGATHYVTVSPTDADLETRDLAKMYTVLARNDKYAIIDLTKKQ